MSLQTDLGLLMLLAARVDGHVEIEPVGDRRIQTRLVVDGQCFIGVGVSVSRAVRSLCEVIEEGAPQVEPLGGRAR